MESENATVMDVRVMVGGRIIGNTIKGDLLCIAFQGGVSYDVQVSQNRMVCLTGTTAVNVGTGCHDITVNFNDVTMVAPEGLTVLGAGTFTAGPNNRGMSTTDPTGTYGGSLGDMFYNPTAGAGDFGAYRCTTAGDDAGAVWKGAELIEA